MTEHLRSLMAAATPGPWEKRGYLDIWSAAEGIVVNRPSLQEQDRSFIVAAVNALPALLAVVDAAREALAEAEHSGAISPADLYHALADLDSLEVGT